MTYISDADKIRTLDENFGEEDNDSDSDVDGEGDVCQLYKMCPAKGSDSAEANPRSSVYVCNNSSNKYMECRIAVVRPDIDVDVLNILDDEVDDDGDDNDNNKDGGRVGRGRQVKSPSSSPSCDIVLFVFEPIGGTAFHHHR